MPYLSASAVVIHYEETLYQVYAPLPFKSHICNVIFDIMYPSFWLSSYIPSLFCMAVHCSWWHSCNTAKPTQSLLLYFVTGSFITLRQTDMRLRISRCCYVQVKAVDGDVGDNANLTYRLLDNPANETSQFDSGPFAVDPATGAVRATASVDREVKDTYRFRVVAADAGSPTAFTSTALITVNVLDYNDEAPQFKVFSHAYCSVQFFFYQNSLQFSGQCFRHCL